MSNKTRKFKCISIHGTKSFLLRCKNGYLLIDTVYPGTYDLFAKGLKKHGVDIREIKFLLLTHHHYDHAGLAHQIIEEAGARLIVHRNEVASLAKGALRQSECTSIWASMFWRIFCLFAKFDYHPVKVKEADYVLEGDDFQLLKEIGIDGIIFHTPGHTEGSLSVLLSDGTAFIGDAAMNYVNVRGVRPLPILAEDLAKVTESWDKLVEQGARIIHPSHGTPFRTERLALKKRRTNRESHR